MRVIYIAFLYSWLNLGRDSMGKRKVLKGKRNSFKLLNITFLGWNKGCEWLGGGGRSYSNWNYMRGATVPAIPACEKTYNKPNRHKTAHPSWEILPKWPEDFGLTNSCTTQFIWTQIIHKHLLAAKTQHLFWPSRCLEPHLTFEDHCCWQQLFVQRLWICHRKSQG